MLFSAKAAEAIFTDRDAAYHEPVVPVAPVVPVYAADTYNDGKPGLPNLPSLEKLLDPSNEVSIEKQKYPMLVQA